MHYDRTRRLAVETAAGSRRAVACSVRYVAISESAASQDLQRHVTDVFALRPLAREGARALYAVDRFTSCTCTHAFTQ